MFGRKKVAMVVAEFLGTFVLTCAIYAVLSQRLPAFFVVSAAGTTLGLMVLILGSTSGAHLNPAVTLGHWIVRRIQPMQAVVYIAAQLLGAFVAWQLLEYLLGVPLRDISTKRFISSVLVAEAVGTFVFTFGLSAAIYQGYKGLRQAVTIGASLTLGALVASIGGNGLVNPAVALGTKSLSFEYLAGPLLGAIAGMMLYTVLFAPTLTTIKTVAKTSTDKTISKITKKKTTKKR